MSSRITVDFAGELRTLAPGETLSFGRGGRNDLVVDSNPHLHRNLGDLFHRDGAWWLRNRGQRMVLNLVDRTSRSKVTLTPGREISVSFPSAAVRFEAGGSTYELLIDLTDACGAAPLDDRDDATATAMTIDQSKVPLVGDQRLLAVALAESALRRPHQALELPANKAVAHRFGWSMTTFNRKLDRMCKKYARAGVSGLVGTAGELATDRRRRLVEHLIGAGIISAADLDLLDDPSG